MMMVHHLNDSYLCLHDFVGNPLSPLGSPTVMRRSPRFLWLPGAQFGFLPMVFYLDEPPLPHWQFNIVNMAMENDPFICI